MPAKLQGMRVNVYSSLAFIQAGCAPQDGVCLNACKVRGDAHKSIALLHLLKPDSPPSVCLSLSLD